MTRLPAPHGDYGIFGPDSVTWRVYRYPTAATMGFQRTALTEMFDPAVVASVAHTSSLRERAADRYDRTLQYAASLVFGSSAHAVEAADTLVRVHARISGIEPISGMRYDPNDPAGQLWIHLTQWHSVLHVYERFGPGPLSAQEESDYWAECAIAAQFQTIDPADVPRNREQMREYYERVRPGLVASATAVEHARIVLDSANSLFSAVPGRLRVFRPLLDALARRATIATLPTWMRDAAGFRQGALTDAAVTALVRPMFRFLQRRPALMAEALGRVSPLAHPVIAPILQDVAPVRPETVSVAEAWGRAGRPLPREQYLARAGRHVVD